MKTTLRLILLTAVIIFSVTMMVAQTAYKDVVYLKNGSIIKGTIVETVPDKSIKIETADGNLFVYNMSEIEKITKEKDTTAPSKESKPVIEQRSSNEGQRSYEGQSSISEGSGSKFSIFGGIALPLGDFAKKFGDVDGAGAAKLGWSAGAQFVTGGSIGFLIEGSYAVNKIDVPSDFITASGTLSYTGWSSIIALVGIKIGTDNSSGTNFFIAPVAGYMFTKSPEMSFTPTGSGTSINVLEAHSGSGFTYGAVVEAVLGGHFIVDAKFVASKPKFKWSVPLYTGGPSQDVEMDQKISLLLVSIGYAF